MKSKILTTLIAGACASAAMAQELTPVWVQHHNGLVNVAPANKLPGLQRRTTPLSQFEAFAAIGPGGTANDYGRMKIKSYEAFMKYDDSHYLLAVNMNGIDEVTETDAASVAAAAAVPDRSLIWIDANTGAYLGVALVVGVHPLPTVPDAVQREITSGQMYFTPGIDDGAYGDRNVYVGYQHKIIRYAAAGTVADPNFPNGRPVWAATPTEAWVEPCPGETAPTIVPGEQGTEAGLAGGDRSWQWRWKDFRVSGAGASLKILGGGGTWRASQHVQEFVTDDAGLHLRPISRSNCRDGGNKGNYSQGGVTGGLRDDVGDATRPGLEWYIHGRYPGTGWEARPSRMLRDPNPTVLDANNVPVPNSRTNRFDVNDAYTGGNLPKFCWESAGTCGNTINHSVDGVAYYDGNWSLGSDTKPGLDYIVNYSFPSWNNQFGAIKKPGWVGVHTLDGNIAPGNANNGWKLPCFETDEPIDGNGVTGHDYGYSGMTYVYPDAGAPAGSQRSTVLVAMGCYGFGVFKVENKAPTGSIPTPTPVVGLQNRPLTLTGNYSGGGTPLFYQWQKETSPGVWTGVKNGNVAKKGQIQPVTIGENLATLGLSGTYRLMVSNQLGVVYSGASTITVNPDLVPPQVVVAGSIDGTGVDITFDELLKNNDADAEGIKDAFNYAVDNLEDNSAAGIVGSPVLLSDGKTVHLNINPATPLTGRFRVSVGSPSSPFADLAGTAMSGEGVPNTVPGHFAEGVVLNCKDVRVGNNPQGQYYAGGPGEFTVVAGGTDIWDPADSMNFLYKQVSGNFDVKVQVVSVTQPNNRDGIMARSTLDPRAAMACNLIHGGQEPSQSLVGAFDRRTDGGNIEWTPGSGNNWDSTYHLPNVWLRLRRLGNTFTSFKSRDGLSWEQNGQVDVVMADPILLGLATDNGGSTTALTTVKYANYGATSALTIQKTVTIQWFNGATLQSAPSPDGPWTTVTGATSPYTVPDDAGNKFYRLVN